MSKVVLNYEIQLLTNTFVVKFTDLVLRTNSVSEDYEWP